jgi:hypothetical protein
VFHTPGWLEAIRHTYGYKPWAFTTSASGDDLQNGIVFCLIDSWITGRRLVSLPFSDHCEPLCDSGETKRVLISNLRTVLEGKQYKYLEVRATDTEFGQICDGLGFLPNALYHLHRLDLRRSLCEIFDGLDKDSVRRRIRRAERAGLVEACGRSDALLKPFYSMFVSTRGRHGVPPMPYCWFQNLIRHLGDALDIRLASKDSVPIAGILTLRFKHVLYFKYGCSVAGFHKFGAVPWLLWNAIAAGRSKDATEFDMGRTEEGNSGLLTFKNHWVPRPESLIYWKFPRTTSLYSASDWKFKMARRIFSCMPDRMLSLTGTYLYRHVG